ncbi:sugar phosphate isomerase/epimerase family protein [Lichenifustis flavocetrariae]|uniref:Sugar phosphate isomerase/epimerase n=1 Tax=Lichenifustis flavocetrariae TaxID=2949735 RepID=A0AA41Z211_9HYPH|nr:sugar phosphate isomerase/epimerase [Lichenifustis flavocetrariae]MCW6512771.1 sugar phosphate isomerase/epimerase [Lichenifustis flavocetrariae]
MRFGASTFIWASPFGADSLYLIDKVKQLGFDLIEICIEDPATIDTDAIGDALNHHGVDALVCGAFGPNRDMSAENDAIRADAARYLRTCIDIAARLGSPTVSGPMYAGVGNTQMRDVAGRRAQRQRSVDGLSPLADYAAERGVKLAFEPLNRFETDLVNTVDQGLELIHEIGRNNVGFLLDTFHMNIEEKNIPDAIRRAGAHIFEFHACSSDRGTPGEDHLPWPQIVAALAEVTYTGPVVIEAFTPKIQEIARAVSLWRPLAESEDALASDGLANLRRVFG